MKNKLLISLLSLTISSSVFSGVKWPMVIFEKSMSESATFSFHSKKKSSFNVRIKEIGGNEQSFKTKVKDSLFVPCCVHEVEAKKLRPGAKYQVKVDGEEKEFYFLTASENGAVILGGDSRSDSFMRQKINRQMLNQIKSNKDIFALVHGGDYIKNGFRWSQWKSWLNDYQLTTSEDGRLLPIIPIRGNHEYLSPIFNLLFSRPSGGVLKNYYTTHWGDLAFVHLNTNLSCSGNQLDWLKSELKTLKDKNKFIIPNYHRPAFPAVKSPGDARRYWVPEFEKHGVKLAFESDGHVYKRTSPIFKGKVDFKNGIRYLGEGGLGVPLRNPEKQNEWYFGQDSMVDSKFHFFLLKKENNAINILSIDEGGKVFDSLKLMK